MKWSVCGNYQNKSGLGEKKNSARLKRKILPWFETSRQLRLKSRVCLYLFCSCFKLSEYCLNIQVHFISKDAHLYKSMIGNEKFSATFESEESLKWPNSGQQFMCKELLAIKRRKLLSKSVCSLQHNWGISSVLKQKTPGFWFWLPFINFVWSLTCPEILFRLFPIVKKRSKNNGYPVYPEVWILNDKMWMKETTKFLCSIHIIAYGNF